MTHAELIAAVMAECGRLKLHYHYCGNSRRCQGTPGLPDLIIAGEGGLMFAELKSDDDDTSAAQDHWLYLLHLAGVPYEVWYPADWFNDTIVAALKELV